MSEADILNWFAGLWPGPQCRESSFLASFAETLHFMGLCILFGALFIIDLRMLGFLRSIPGASVLTFTRWAIIGFLVNAASGWLFFTCTPTVYWGNQAFKMKMALILLAGVNALVFTMLDHRKVAALGPDDDTSIVSKATAAMSLMLWLGVLILGRMLPAFTVSPN